MSRLFEALQRSEPETFGFDFTLPEPPVSELLKAAEAETLKPTEAEAPNSAETQMPEFGQFPSLPVLLPPGSRLVSLSGREESSLGAEKFRFLAVRLRQIRRGRDFKKLLITSTIPGEGKSTVSANLAVALAHRKQQTILLVDGDLRRPVLAHEFGLGDQAGLSECLRGEPRPITNIYRLESAGLWFLPAGQPTGESAGFDAVWAAFGSARSTDGLVRLDRDRHSSSFAPRRHERLDPACGWRSARGPGRNN